MNLIDDKRMKFSLRVINALQTNSGYAKMLNDYNLLIQIRNNYESK